MNPDLIVIVVVTAVAAVGLAGLWVTVRDAPLDEQDLTPQVRQPGLLDRTRNVIDRSVGMYILRRVTGRPTEPPPEPTVVPPALSADQVSFRIGIGEEPLLAESGTPVGLAPVAGATMAADPDAAGAEAAATQAAAAAKAGAAAQAAVAAQAAAMAARMPREAPGVARGVGAARIRGAGKASAAGTMAAADTMGVATATSPVRVDDGPSRPGEPAEPRQRLLQDAGFALVALTIVGLVAVAVWPRADATGPGPSGSAFAVVETSATPETTASPAPIVTLGASPSPSPSPSPSASPSPTATPRVIPTPTPVPTPTPTPRLTQQPTPKPPKPIAGFTCSNVGLTLTCDGHVSRYASTWGWSFGDGGRRSGAGPVVHKYTVAGLYIVTLTVTNASGRDSDQQQVTVGP